MIRETYFLSKLESQYFYILSKFTSVNKLKKGATNIANAFISCSISGLFWDSLIKFGDELKRQCNNPFINPFVVELSHLIKTPRAVIT